MTDKRIRFDVFEVDFSRREIRKSGTRVRLQRKPFQILELLLQNPGRLVRREEIARHVWPDSHVSLERCLNTAVNVLRQALGDTSHGCRFIETRAGFGYVFIAPIAQVDRGIVETDCLPGRYLLAKMTEEDTHKAIAYFEAALQSNDRPAAAYCGLAEAWCELGRLWCSPARAAPKAREFALLALSSDSTMAEAHAVVARVRMLFDWDWKEGRAGFVRALALNPDCGMANRHYASLLVLVEEKQNALNRIEAAIAAEPLSLPALVERAWILYLRRDYEAAAEQCWRILALESRFWPAQLVLGLAYERSGRNEDATAELENAVICSGRNPLAVGALARSDSSRALDLMRELRQLAAFRYVSPIALAFAHLGAGEEEDAAIFLARGFEQRDTGCFWLEERRLAAGKRE